MSTPVLPRAVLETPSAPSQTVKEVDQLIIGHNAPVHSSVEDVFPERGFLSTPPSLPPMPPPNLSSAAVVMLPEKQGAGAGRQCTPQARQAVGTSRERNGGRRQTVALGIRKLRRRISSQSGGRGSGFSRQEVDNLLEVLDEHLPLAKEEWDHILRLHSERYSEYGRTIDSLKRKFASLYRSKVPTGDPSIPPDVEKAKQIRYRMTERADIGEGAESDLALCGFQSDDVRRDTNPTNETPTSTDGDPSFEGTRQSTPADTALRASSRPLVRRRVSKETRESSIAEIIELYKLQMVQDQTRRESEQAEKVLEREEEKKWRMEQREEHARRAVEREEERKERAKERRLEREARAEDAKRHERLMEMMLLAITKK